MVHRLKTTDDTMTFSLPPLLRWGLAALFSPLLVPGPYVIYGIFAVLHPDWRNPAVWLIFLAIVAGCLGVASPALLCLFPVRTTVDGRGGHYVRSWNFFGRVRRKVIGREDVRAVGVTHVGYNIYHIIVVRGSRVHAMAPFVPAAPGKAAYHDMICSSYRRETLVPHAERVASLLRVPYVEDLSASND